jgi:hypothetical protein
MDGLNMEGIFALFFLLWIVAIVYFAVGRPAPGTLQRPPGNGLPPPPAPV